MIRKRQEAVDEGSRSWRGRALKCAGRPPDLGPDNISCPRTCRGSTTSRYSYIHLFCTCICCSDQYFCFEAAHYCTHILHDTLRPYWTTIRGPIFATAKARAISQHISLSLLNAPSGLSSSYARQDISIYGHILTSVAPHALEDILSKSGCLYALYSIRLKARRSLVAHCTFGRVGSTAKTQRLKLHTSAAGHRQAVHERDQPSQSIAATLGASLIAHICSCRKYSDVCYGRGRVLTVLIDLSRRLQH